MPVYIYACEGRVNLRLGNVCCCSCYCSVIDGFRCFLFCQFLPSVPFLWPETPSIVKNCYPMLCTVSTRYTCYISCCYIFCVFHCLEVLLLHVACLVFFVCFFVFKKKCYVILPVSLLLLLLKCSYSLYCIVCSIG